MSSIIAYAMVVMLVTLVMLMGASLSYNINLSHENGSPFECGFDPFGVSRVPFCINFFLISIIFLVFDVEISLVFPIIYSLYQVLSFLLILLGGLCYEWAYGGLQWIV